ncbi:MAG: hypothetical protein Q8J89_02730 [Caulobacter sp.]|nr:hypothetical protein [Caulobacter sp.]
MTVPARFATDFPKRCLELLENFEHQAGRLNLLTSFGVTMASALLVIPMERQGKKHPFREQEYGSSLQKALRVLERQRWQLADFWEGAHPLGWHFSRIVTDPNLVGGWLDQNGVPSASAGADTMERRSVSEVLRVLRNALAHGNIVYLDPTRSEVPGLPVRYIAFLSRYEQPAPTSGTSGVAMPETYRVVIVPDEDFIAFLKDWARWLMRYAADEVDVVAA